MEDQAAFASPVHDVCCFMLMFLQAMHSADHQVHFCVLFATRVDRGSTGCSTHLINRCVPEPLLGTAQPFEEAEWFRIVVTSTLCEWRDGQNVEVTDDEGDEVHSLCCVLL